MGKLSIKNSLKRNDANRKFPPLGVPLTKEQAAELKTLLGPNFKDFTVDNDEN
jgi:hypothetical protein